MKKIIKNKLVFLNKDRLLDLSIVLFLASLPFSYGFINFFLILFIFFTLLNYKILKYRFSFSLLLPILFYIIGAISIIWSIDPIKSEKNLSKSLLFFVIPIIFSFLPKINQNKKLFYLNNYAILTVISSLFFLFRALIRFLKTHDKSYFFYHNLVTLKVNAIYVSLFVSFALMIFLVKTNKKHIDYISILILFTFLILLSSKNVIVVTIFCIILNFILKFNTFPKKSIFTFILSFLILLIPLGSSIKNRFNIELQGISKDYTLDNGDILVSLNSAWNKRSFEGGNGNSYVFNGSSFRLYQIRIFKEFLEEEDIFWTGFGAHASQIKIIEKQKKYHLNPYYGELNFHNQYIQVFSELGIFGLLILILMLLLSIVKAFKRRNFLFLFFTILMTSIFFSESLFARERGVIFFILIYSIFNNLSYRKNNY